MANPEHTPGPWKTDSGRTPTRIIGPGGQTVAAAYGGFVGGDVEGANARLIAAAPALLQYVAERAREGDESARQLVAGLEPPRPTGE